MAVVIASTYEIIERLGSGGGGVVYLANHLRLNKKVVLKADKRELSARPEILRREVDALKDLSNQYIPQVYDYFIESETVYTVIDFVDGESMDKPLKRGERFSQAQVIKWACELLDALSYLHSPTHGTPPRGIVHSDIKPANIMLMPTGDIKLIDFNIALALGEENVVGLSAGYASPEHYGLDFSTDSLVTESDIQKKKFDDETETMSNLNETLTMGAETATIGSVTVTMQNKNSEYSSSKKIIIPDVRSDIYSLGATLYHLLSGKRPNKNAKEVEPLTSKEVSPLIADIVNKAMNPNPDLRYQTAEEMLYAFTHLRDNDPRTIKRKRFFTIANALFTVAIVGGIFTSFVGLKRMETVQKSLTFAEYSKNALENGDQDLAIHYALEALPTENNIFVPSYTPQAQKALSDALGVYDLSDGFKSYKTIELPAETFKTVLSPNGKTGLAVYSFSVAVFNTETGNIIVTLPTVKSALADAKYINDEIIIYAGANGITAYNIKDNSEIWRGKKATHIEVSGDGKTIVGVYRDENFATIYNVDGSERAIVDFKGNKQRVISNDTFADPKDNLLALNFSGNYLAVSFENGALEIFDVSNTDNDIELYDQSDYTHFEGGFNGRYFAFSANKSDTSEFVVIDLEKLEQTIGIKTDGNIGVIANEENIYLYNKSTVVTINPITGEQTEVAYTDSDVRAFETDNNCTIIATEKNEFLFYDNDADVMSRFKFGQIKYDFVDISNDYAVVAGMDTPILRILKKSQYNESNIVSYDKDYVHDEARISEKGDRLMIFGYKSFRIYDIKGNLINETLIPNSENVYDQQFIKESGNLAVIYNDAFRLYSGEDGQLLYEAENLKNVLYANYGVSTFDGTEIRLINLNNGEIENSEKYNGNYGAYCGTVIDDSIISGGSIIGASVKDNNYYYAVKNNKVCSVYNGINKLFEIPIEEQTEVFFTEKGIITSPLHGTPKVFNLKSGEKVKDLEKDSYLTYVTEVDKHLITEYISASGYKYGLLLDKNNYDILANISGLTDINANELIYDYKKGNLRKSRIYPINELIEIAKEVDK